MGAIFDSCTLEAPSEDKALERARDVMEDYRHQYGHDTYAGHLGICDGVQSVKPHLCKATEQEAYDWGEQNCEKWGPAALMRIGTTNKYVLMGWCAS